MMLKYLLSVLSMLCFSLGQAQVFDSNTNELNPNAVKKTKKGFDKTTIDQYKIISLQRDTTYVDTTLTLKAEYTHNYLRKDQFGLLSFANEGFAYNTLYHGLQSLHKNPQFGFHARQQAYLNIEDINYYNVATPVTDLYYKSVMGQGQNLDAFVTGNISKQLNFAIAYKGLRSTGNYFNELTSNGNFRFITSYNTKDKRYFLKGHITAQDFSNQENGGLSDLSQFEGDESVYSDKGRLDVYLENAKSMMKGNRVFFDHTFKLSKSNPNSLMLHHQFTYENKSYEFINTNVNDRFGSYYSNDIHDKTRFNTVYNKLGVAFKTQNWGSLEAFVDYATYHYFYNQVVYTTAGLVANNDNYTTNALGVNYTYQENDWKANLNASANINGPSNAFVDGSLRYRFGNDKENKLVFNYVYSSQIPDFYYNLFQSSYVNYNWSNNFKNEKINQVKLEANTRWFDLGISYKMMQDHLYFSNTATALNTDGLSTQLLVKPIQFADGINYFSVKLGKDVKFGKFGLDNTFLYQKVDQSQAVLNVPDFVTRNTLYFNDHFFNKALYLQTGVTFNYFTSYFADDYNPVLGSFYTQTQKEVGGYPMLDFFVNAKIRTFRLFLKLEHFNSDLSNSKYYVTPNYTTRSFMFRFGVTWNFFS